MAPTFSPSRAGARGRRDVPLLPRLLAGTRSTGFMVVLSLRYGQPLPMASVVWVRGKVEGFGNGAGEEMGAANDP
jgi:hypothetical protein